jgi:hypothetical protein
MEDTIDEVDYDSDNAEHEVPKELHEKPVTPSQPIKTQSDSTVRDKPKGCQVPRPMANSSIIASINPSRHNFRGWNPQPYPIHEDVGMEVGKELLKRMNRALRYPEPAFQSTKVIREMMMTKFWQKHRIEDVHKGSCGHEIQWCLHDIIKDLGQMNEMDMRDQITIRMTKTTQQDQPPYYSIQDTVPIQHLITGLIEFGSNDIIKDEWYQQTAPYVVVGTHITMDDLTNDCDAAVEINEEPPHIILWTRRNLDISSETIDHKQRPSKTEAQVSM